MSVVFRECVHSPLEGVTVSAPGSAVIGVIGDTGAGKESLLRLAAGVVPPVSGEVIADLPRRFHGPLDPIQWEPSGTLVFYHTFALLDAAARARAAMDLELFRRRGGTVLVASHELDLIREISDEVWWLDEGKLAAKGDPREVIERYRRHSAARIRREAQSRQLPLPPAIRRGDGRAELVSIETLDNEARAVSVWRSGEEARIRVEVRFHQPVADPVVGIMIRTRIGFEVYGTNTELEHVKLGPCAAGERIEVVFRMACHLCPGEYTLTVASHDPDGVWHDWVEDGVAVAVTDSRYTAGVACLRSNVEVRRLT